MRKKLFAVLTSPKILMEAPWELVDEFDQHYIGINYLFDGHDIKFMLGYEMNELKDTEENGGSQDIDGFRARLQFLF